MKKNYVYIMFFILLFSLGVLAQEARLSSFAAKNQEQQFDNLNVYPNPVGNGRVFITSKTADPKDVEIFDVLGKRVIQTTIVTKELNVSSLSPGVYIIKIKEGEQRATRKLIIK
ncbi:T9SS type A sorting domain-containing protein [Flavobacterium psychrophilum]|uniref:Secretion system C-terminal sorting domain-containing protein n=2 Tax=Flavobacterium psychrophilum TaxID=96345 RepID=A6GVW5_FLAPJ|nr:T9SS type A sorting domain-containing protein [Flavobacterium psychrophilum]AIG29066.1 secretion protein [Flavobacterium psychrophilum]AIG31342.1 secretion protein [Flavobacterium psychrophilum]AIG35762.1 secretion protein [Flavobacterium psychrophilum]AIG35868.1 secretion protein [Flavobacterium psychrophilum]AIG38123.1 secretion protein [Flavobacterium psychrophilum]